MDRGFEFRGRKILIREPSYRVQLPQKRHGIENQHDAEPQQAHEHPQQAHEHPQQDCCDDQHGHCDHETHFELIIDGEKFVVHRMKDGVFHTHDLPFVVHKSIEDAAKALVNLRSLGMSHGRTKKPKQTY